MNRLAWIGVLVAVLLVAGYGCLRSREAATPEAMVAQVMAACQGGDYGQVARLFVSGEHIWATSPGLVRQRMERICSGGLAVGFEIEARREKPQETVLMITTYRDREKQQPLRSYAWIFARQEHGWAIEGVE